jgi:3-hydroxy-3-methylglutaryl CoA synthase
MISDDYLFTNIGIDSFSFYAPRYFVDLKELAVVRKIDPNKFRKGLLLKEMRLPEVDEDIISMGLKAGYGALIRGNISPKKIDAVFVGTETITYAVKSVSNIFADLLGISLNSMTQDIYNACAGGTLAIINAIALIKQEIINRALVICTDVCSYNLGSSSEPTQGSGAIAFVISKNPRVARFSKKYGKISANINDFFRPAHEKNAKVFGHYSVETYLNFQLSAYDDLIKNIGNFHADFYTFHAPFAKLPIKCMQHIILKRWKSHIENLVKLKKSRIKSSIIKKLDYFLHDVTILPEYIYLKLREKGFSSETLEDIYHKMIVNIKGRVLPQLRIPSYFGNMYNASIWAQIIYILENCGHVNNTIFFGSYGSGAICLSGLLKIQPKFREVLKKGPYINDFINYKEHMSVKQYELIKTGNFKLKFLLGRIIEHEENNERGLTFHFCDEGCLIPHFNKLNYCPKGHSGYHKKFFPLFAVLNSNPMINKNENDLSYLHKGLVRIGDNVKKGNILELGIRRVENKNEQNFNAIGLLNWTPVYVPAQKLY